MSERFYIDGPPTGQKVALDKAQSSHMVKVMRRRDGDVVTLFDGRGTEYEARIVRASHNGAELEIVERREVSRELPVRITLAIAPPKSGPMDTIIRQATELGAAKIQPVYCERSVAKYADAAKKRDKWIKATIEACKQCGRNTLPEIAEPLDFREAITALPPQTRALLLHTAPSAITLVKAMGSAAKSTHVAIFIGPEGGFAPDETAFATAAGVPAVRIFPQIMRVETATAAALAIIAHQYAL